MQPPFILCLPPRDSLDDFEPHLLSLRWHKAFPKDGREKWDKRAERETKRGVVWWGGGRGWGAERREGVSRGITIACLRKVTTLGFSGRGVVYI